MIDFKKTYKYCVNNTEEILNRTKNCSREIFWYEDIIPKNQEGWIANMPEEENKIGKKNWKYIKQINLINKHTKAKEINTHNEATETLAETKTNGIYVNN